MNILFNLINQKLYYNFSKQNNTFINIGYGIDSNYARCCATSITSFCLNNPTKNFNFHIMAKDLSTTNKKQFEQLAQLYSINIYIYEINNYSN